MKYGTKCPLCKEEEESMEHFLLLCPALHTARDTYISSLLQLITTYDLTIPEDIPFTRIILDPTLITLGNRDAEAPLETLTRNLCFSLHQARSRILSSQPTNSHSVNINMPKIYDSEQGPSSSYIGNDGSSKNWREVQRK